MTPGPGGFDEAARSVDIRLLRIAEGSRTFNLRPDWVGHSPRQLVVPSYERGDSRNCAGRSGRPAMSFDRRKPVSASEAGYTRERDRGLEPLLEAWKATVLPLHQSRQRTPSR